jgi:hypothetical protein
MYHLVAPSQLLGAKGRQAVCSSSPFLGLGQGWLHSALEQLPVDLHL